MAIPRNVQRTAEVFTKAGLVDELQMKSAMARLEQWGGRLVRVLSELGFADEDTLMETLSKAVAVPVVHLGNVVKDPEAIRKLEASFCEENAVFPVSVKDRTLTLALVDPLDIALIDVIKARAGLRVSLVLASETEVRNAIDKHYHGREPRVVSNKARKAVTRDVPLDQGGELKLDFSKPPTENKIDVKSFREQQREDLEREYAESRGEKPNVAPQFTKEEIARIEAARQNQAKTTKILRAVEELLAEKGFSLRK